MQIHLITFDIPFPADYGGVIDVFYKLETMHALGFQVTLHCFQYGNRKPSPRLERLAAKVFYYERRISLKYFFSNLPFIVATRNDKSLLDNLLADNAPIFFEGIHSTFYVNHHALSERMKIVRMHNVEYLYYAQLAKMERNILKKIFFWSESQKLKKYEKNIASSNNIKFLAISEKDFKIYVEHGATQIEVCSPFHPFEEVKIQEGRSDYILFHGNLSVRDNELAALFLVEKIFSNNKIPFIIAGKNPTKKLFEKCKQFSNINIIPNPNEAEMNELIQNAHINLLWSFQAEGIKLKLFYALFLGRFIIANKNITNNLVLNEVIMEIENIDFLLEEINKKMSQIFDYQYIEDRKKILFNWKKNQKNVLKKIFETI
jgi:hypothetical protein